MGRLVHVRELWMVLSRVSGMRRMSKEEAMTLGCVPASVDEFTQAQAPKEP